MDEVLYTIKIGNKELLINKTEAANDKTYPRKDTFGLICITNDNVYLKNETNITLTGNLEEDSQIIDEEKFAAYFPLYIIDKENISYSFTQAKGPYENSSWQIGWYVVPSAEEYPYEYIEKLCLDEIYDLNAWESKEVYYYVIKNGRGETEEISKYYYGFDRLNDILSSFRLPLSVAPDGELCLHSKSKKLHTKKHIYAKCKYIMTKDGMKELKELK